MRHDEASVTRFAAELESHFNRQAMTIKPTAFNTVFALSNTILSSVQIIVIILMVMALIIAAVGAISLSGTLSINVLERRREIGVLRAVGAPNSGISGLFITEGLILGWLSWLIAFPLSWPAGYLLTLAVSSSMDQITVIYQYNFSAILIWLAIVTIITVVASWAPAQRAIKVSVRESLAYE